jgi:hypothetical protein
MNKNIEDLQIDFLCATFGNELEVRQIEEVNKKNKMKNNFNPKRFRRFR